MPKERISYIDFMKGLCIILIVIGHIPNFSFDAILPNLNFALKSFRIPLYFFLSGLFFKTYNGFGDFLRKKVNNLVITLLFFHFLSSLLCFPLIEIVHHYRPDIDVGIPSSYAIPSFFRRQWYAAGALWFLVALFMVNILYYLFYKYLNKIVRIIAIVLCSVTGWVLMKYKIELPFELDIALVAMPYFMLGSVVKSKGFLQSSKYDKYGFLAIIPCSIVVYLCSSDINFLYQVVPDYFSLYLVPFLAVLSLFWFCKNLGYVPFVSYIGRYSIIVLGTHQILIRYISFAFTGIAGVHGLSLQIATIVTILLLELVVIRFMIKYFPRFTAQKEFFKSGWTL